STVDTPLRRREQPVVAGIEATLPAGKEVVIAECRRDLYAETLSGRGQYLRRQGATCAQGIPERLIQRAVVLLEGRHNDFGEVSAARGRGDTPWFTPRARRPDYRLTGRLTAAAHSFFGSGSRRGS